MSLKTLTFCVVLVSHILTGLGNPVHADASVLKISSVNSKSHATTPAGLFPVENIHAVPYGARVHQTESAVHIISSEGAILHTAPVTPTTKIKKTSTTVAPRALSSGYVAYSYWKNNGTSPISSFSTTLTVPPLPTKKNGQILYLFNGLIPNSFDGIFQPVLQFGSTPAGGGNYWAVASWYLINSNVYFTAPNQVRSGQSITGVMTLKSTTTSGNTTTYNWNSIFTGITSTSLSISTTEIFNYAYEALEIYSVSADSYLPKGSTSMTSIDIMTQDGQHPQLNWTVITDSQDGFKFAVLNNASTNGEVQITYP